MVLKADFFNTDAISLAKKLLGKIIVREINDNIIKCMIVETEAYVGPKDKACHAFNNKRTKRTEVMFWDSGFSYVYLIYGMYYCFNIVASDKEKPEAVLIRAVEPIEGVDLIKENRKIKSNKIKDLTNGPGKLCQALSIDKTFNGFNLTKGDKLYLENGDKINETKIESSPRINIDYAEEYIDKKWRFFIKNNNFLSK